MLEPTGGNTAPAILLAALNIQSRHGDDAVLLVLPADHLVADTAAFASDVQTAALLAKPARCLDASLPETRAPYLELAFNELAALEDTSIDYGIMEKSRGAALVPAHFDWSDTGSWHALADRVAPDEHSNRHTGAVVDIDSHNCFIHGESRLIATIGLDGMTIVDTRDALLVSRHDRLNDVRKIVKQIKQEGRDSHQWQRTVLRPWG